MQHQPTVRALLFVAAFAAVPLTVVSSANAGERRSYQAPSFVQTALELDVAIDYDKPAVSGTATITLANRGGQPLGEVPLLLNRLMTIREVRDGAKRKLAVRSAITVFEDEPLRQVVYARVTCARAVAPGKSVALRVAFGGALSNFVEAGNRYVKDKIDPPFTILRSDAYAYPVLGVPSGAANRAILRDKFRFRARVAVPDDEIVASGGRLVDRRSANGRTTYEFAGNDVPFLNVVIAPYRVVEKDNVRVYALPDDEARATPLIEAVQQALGRLESMYGPLGTTPYITIMEVPDGFSSQASLNAGVILEAIAFRERVRLMDLYHEVTHFWNPTDLDVPSPRWTEGLARYLEYRLGREIDGYANTSAALERARKSVCGGSALPALRKTPFVEYGRADLTNYSYTVGMLMFSALDSIVGPGALDAGVRAHVQGHRAAGGTTVDLVKTLKQAAAPADLDGFFDDWMFTSAWVDRVCPAPSFAEAVGAWKK